MNPCDIPVVGQGATWVLIIAAALGGLLGGWWANEVFRSIRRTFIGVKMALPGLRWVGYTVAVTLGAVGVGYVMLVGL